jgi:oligopeptide/dipeptide ABC transporter ATP-binding protein
VTIADALLEVTDLTVEFTAARAVDRVTLTIGTGQVVALMGESGSGKSSLALSLIGLLPAEARVRGSIRFAGQERLGAGAAGFARLRGAAIGAVFQDPMSSLNPVLTIGEQIDEVLRTHKGLGRRAARHRTVEILGEVGIADPAERAAAFPHQLSGGLRQRAAIAMAIAAEPQLLLADEPTTALDATVQAQILQLLDSLRRRTGLAVLLITHDFGVAAEIADRIAVLYAGRLVEEGPAAALTEQPLHPYAKGLLAASVMFEAGGRHHLAEIPGAPPIPGAAIAGCAFAPRCPAVMERCRAEAPALTGQGDRRVRCFLFSEAAEP